MLPEKTARPRWINITSSSRSPEQMRPTILSPVQSEFTLPPMQLQGLALHEEQTHASTVQVSSLGTSHSPDETAEAAAPTSLDHDAERASHASQGEDFTSQAQLPHLTTNTSKTPVATDRSTSSPTRIKQETVPTPRAISPANANPPPSSQQSAITSLKNEQGIRTQSPLRESSVPVPSTEIGDQSIGAKETPSATKSEERHRIHHEEGASVQKAQGRAEAIRDTLIVTEFQSSRLQDRQHQRNTRELFTCSLLSIRVRRPRRRRGR